MSHDTVRTYAHTYCLKSSVRMSLKAVSLNNYPNWALKCPFKDSINEMLPSRVSLIEIKLKSARIVLVHLTDNIFSAIQTFTLTATQLFVTLAAVRPETPAPSSAVSGEINARLCNTRPEVQYPGARDRYCFPVRFRRVIKMGFLLIVYLPDIASTRRPQ